MAHLVASDLSSGKIIDQAINSEWIDALEAELDVISIKIGGVDFTNILLSTTTIGYWIAALEEEKSQQYDNLEVYLAYAQRFCGKDPSVSDVVEKADEHFVSLILEEGACDAKEVFAAERAEEYLATLEDSLDSQQYSFVLQYFDHEKYAQDIFINDFAAVTINKKDHSETFIFSTK